MSIFSSETSALTSKLIELTGCIGELKTRAEVAEAKLKCAEERSQLLLEAKNMWMDRALKAENPLGNIAAVTPTPPCPSMKLGQQCTQPAGHEGYHMEGNECWSGK